MKQTPGFLRQISQRFLDEVNVSVEVKRKVTDAKKGREANSKFYEKVDTDAIDQTPSMCGPASLKAVLAQYDDDYELEELADEIGASEESGADPEDIIDAAKRLGYKAWIERDSTFDRLQELIEAGVPPIVDWFKDDDGHYSVVNDINDTEIEIMDPELGEKKWITREEFDPIWFDFPIGDDDHRDPINKLIIVVTKPGMRVKAQK